jgi:hypothetical protein
MAGAVIGLRDHVVRIAPAGPRLGALLVGPLQDQPISIVGNGGISPADLPDVPAAADALHHQPRHVRQIRPVIHPSQRVGTLSVTGSLASCREIKGKIEALALA